ncbi:MAG: NAD(P)H-dependent oxidoreductase [Tissierellia bacterium]|nr:NAD(P)H-dependent oxidoreductase [Tissierellia bacterium]
MKDIVLVIPEKPSPILNKMIEKVLGNENLTVIDSPESLPNMQNRKILFAVELNEIGTSNNLNSIFLKLYQRGKDSLYGSEGAILIHSNFPLFTKTYAQSIAFWANSLGCSFTGRPLVEATKDLENFKAMERVYNMALEDICLLQCEELGKRFLATYPDRPRDKNKLLVLHSSHRDTSNTLTLWDMVERNLSGIEINEINIGNGNILDCQGCHYKTCKHFGKQNRCFYGGIIVEEVYPAVLEADSILFICPNYNDMLTANLVGSINRLTALYRKTKFYDKTMFAIIVSGYSGGDALAKQLISSLNMNKTFRLPPYFSLMAVANHKGDINKLPNIEEKARTYALNIMREI